MLTVRNIYKRYGPIRVLLGADFSVSRGQKVALVGSNGVGKSTLLRIIAGIEKEDRGEVIRERRANISYLPQELPADIIDDTAFGYLRRVSGIAELEEIRRQACRRSTGSPRRRSTIAKAGSRPAGSGR